MDPECTFEPKLANLQRQVIRVRRKRKKKKTTERNSQRHQQ
jgi:hypothetical protein